MNQNRYLLFSASSVGQLKEAIKSNLDVNQFHNEYFQTVIQYYLNLHKIDLLTSDKQVSDNDTLYEMIKLLIEAGAELDQTINSLFMCTIPLLFRKKLCRLFLDNGAECDETDNFYNYYSPELLQYIKVDYKLEKIKENICARKVQRWFLKMYYDPYHSYGKARLEREFLELERELTKK